MGKIEYFPETSLQPRSFDAELPSITRALATAQSQVAKLDIAGEMTALGHPVSYRAVPCPLTTEQAGVVAALRIDDLPVTMGLNCGGLDLIKACGQRPVDFTGIPSEMLAHLIEHVLTPDLEEAEQRTGLRVEIDTVSLKKRHHPHEAILALDVSLGDTTFQALFWTDTPDALIERLAITYPQKPERSLPDIMAQLSVIGPLAVLPRAQMANLAPDDIVQIGPGWHNLDNLLHLVINNSHIVPIRAAENGMVVDGDANDFQDLMNRFSDGDSMSDNTSDHAGSVADPRNLITIELNRTEMTTSELQAIQEGDVLDFDIRTVQEVTLYASGHPIALGRLVQLDDIIGVQVSKLL